MKIPASDLDLDYRIEHAWKDFLEPVLREEGFKGSGRNFRCSEHEFVKCVSFQSAQHGGRFAINLGVQPTMIPDVTGNDVNVSKICEIDCEFRRRLTDGATDQWWSYTQLNSSKIQAAQDAATSLVKFGLPSFARMVGSQSQLLAINPITFAAGAFDFSGFISTKVRMARALALIRLAHGDKGASRAFAALALAEISGSSGSGLRAELMELARAD